MKKNIVDYLTYQEKVDILNHYYNSTKTENPYTSNLAKEMAYVYKSSIKLNYYLAADICDEILRNSTKITRSRAVAPSIAEKNKEPRLLANIVPQIIEFSPKAQDFEKIVVLKRYLNKELAKQKENVSTL